MASFFSVSLFFCCQSTVKLTDLKIWTHQVYFNHILELVNMFKHPSVSWKSSLVLAVLSVNTQLQWQWPQVYEFCQIVNTSIVASKQPCKTDLSKVVCRQGDGKWSRCRLFYFFEGHYGKFLQGDNNFWRRAKWNKKQQHIQQGKKVKISLFEIND